MIRRLRALAVASGFLLLLATLFEGLKLLLYLMFWRCFLDAYVAIQTW